MTALYCGACCNKMKQKCRKVGASFKRPNRILRRFMDGVRVACGKCGLRDLNYGDAEEHIQECGVYRVECLLSCGMVLSGVKEAAEHWEKCPANLTECMVCKSKYNITDMASHDCRAKLLSKINELEKKLARVPDDTAEVNKLRALMQEQKTKSCLEIAMLEAERIKLNLKVLECKKKLLEREKDHEKVAFKLKEMRQTFKTMRSLCVDECSSTEEKFAEIQREAQARELNKRKGDGKEANL